MRYLLSQYQEKREGAGENTLSFAGCISRYSFGAHRRCLRSSFWHQVCNKRWQTCRGVNTDLRPLSARYGASGQQPYWPQPLLLPLAALCTVGHWLHSPATIAQERKAQARRCSHLPRAEARQREQAGGSALQKEELQLGEKDSSDY